MFEDGRAVWTVTLSRIGFSAFASVSILSELPLGRAEFLSGPISLVFLMVDCQNPPTGLA